MIIIIFGPPGVGKGTQAKLLSEKLDMLNFSIGDKLRKEIELKTPLGEEIKETLSKGDLISDEIVLKIAEKFIVDNRNKNIILDGFPRTVNQAERLTNIFESQKIQDIKIITLTSEKQELIKRLLKRAKIQGRSDDNEQTIKNRLNIYELETKPILNYYKKTNYKLLNVDGMGDINSINKNILSLLD